MKKDVNDFLNYPSLNKAKVLSQIKLNPPKISTSKICVLCFLSVLTWHLHGQHFQMTPIKKSAHFTNGRKSLDTQGIHPHSFENLILEIVPNFFFHSVCVCYSLLSKSNPQRRLQEGLHPPYKMPVTIYPQDPFIYLVCKIHLPPTNAPQIVTQLCVHSKHRISLCKTDPNVKESPYVKTLDITSF